MSKKGSAWNWPARFWEKVEKAGDADCWTWTGAKKNLGYGNVRYLGRVLAAHRVAYELLIGPIPDGLVLDHLCRNPRCVNPAHLEPVTQQANTLRGEGRAAQQAKRTHCPAGHPYSPENTYRLAGRRYCRACRSAHGGAAA